MLKSQKSDVKKESVPQNVKLTKYIFEDKKKEVKIHIDLGHKEFGGNEINENMVSLDAEEKKFTLTIVDGNSNTYTLTVEKLYDKIVPDECKVVVTESKIKVHLKKWIETKWYNLQKTT